MSEPTRGLNVGKLLELLADWAGALAANDEEGRTGPPSAIERAASGADALSQQHVNRLREIALASRDVCGWLDQAVRVYIEPDDPDEGPSLPAEIVVDPYDGGLVIVPERDAGRWQSRFAENADEIFRAAAEFDDEEEDVNE